VDVPAHGERRLLRLDRLEHRARAEAAAAARVDVAERRGVDGEHGVARAALQQLRRRLLRQVETPVPRRDRDPAAEPEDRHAGHVGLLAVEHGGGVPFLTRRPQRPVGLVVSRHHHHRALDSSQGTDRLLEPSVHRREVAHRQHGVGVPRGLDEAVRLGEIAVQVAEGEQLQAGPFVSECLQL
jgi:hypothetical protein